MIAQPGNTLPSLLYKISYAADHDIYFVVRGTLLLVSLLLFEDR